MSAITWLDQSREQNRQVREMVRLFSLTESRDELGIGQIRDVLSDQMFPGTSVLHTRARYALFVPWLFQGQPDRYRGAELLARVQRQERELIGTLKDAGATRGLIGINAGIKIKNLPSAMYWNALTTWGALTDPVAADGLRSDEADVFEADELTERSRSDWIEMPSPPPGFPKEVRGGFDLTADEALWLAERIQATESDSLLAHLIQRSDPPSADSSFAWADPATRDAPGDAARWLVHASCFSTAMHGAALLYNLLLAEAYERAGHTTADVSQDDFRERLAAWAAEVQSWSSLGAWDAVGFRDEVVLRNPRIPPATWDFVLQWIDIATSGVDVATDADARSLVERRERLQKKGQSRFHNPKQLERWSGAAGMGQLTFRWAVVRDLVTDIHDGRNRA